MRRGGRGELCNFCREPRARGRREDEEESDGTNGERREGSRENSDNEDGGEGGSGGGGEGGGWITSRRPGPTFPVSTGAVRVASRRVASSHLASPGLASLISPHLLVTPRPGPPRCCRCSDGQRNPGIPRIRLECVSMSLRRRMNEPGKVQRMIKKRRPESYRCCFFFDIFDIFKVSFALP